jgi:hypothetical protein
MPDLLSLYKEDPEMVKNKSIFKFPAAVFPAACSSTCAVSCHGTPVKRTKEASIKRRVSSMSKKRTERKSWTFMVYMAGDNNLDPNGVIDLKEMKKIGSTDEVNVIAQFDRASGHAAKRYYLRKGGETAADAVATIGKINTGDPKRLMDFIQWAAAKYPAERYALVLWNHGQGWDDTDLFAGERYRPLRRLTSGRIRHTFFHSPVRRMLKKAAGDANLRAILIDDNARDFLDNVEMKNVLDGARKLLRKKIDVLGMDACLMSMAEVGYQIREGASFTVGSEETEPLNGWPYDAILAALARDPGMTAQDLSSLIVDRYIASYSSEAVTQSACDLSKADALAAAVSGLTNVLNEGLEDPAIRQCVLTARTQAQTYEVPDNIDLVDFCSLLARSVSDSAIADRCRDVVHAVETGYVVANACKGDSMKNSKGVAVYFPTRAVSSLYDRLEFSKATGWNAFLTAYLAAVRSR